MAPSIAHGATFAPYVPDLTFRVTNFKSIAAVELPPARLVVLAGSNSSGKSSLLQAALFMTQSLAAEAPVINGDLVILGEPRDVIRDGAKDVSFEFVFEHVSPEEETSKPGAYRVTLGEAKSELRPTRVSLWQEHRQVLASSLGSSPPDLLKRISARETLLHLENADELKLPRESYLSVVGIQPGRLFYRASSEFLQRSFKGLIEAPVSSYMLQELIFELLRSRRASEIPDALQRRISALQHGREPFSPQGENLSEEEAEALFELYVESVAPNGWASEGISLPPLGRQMAGFGPSFSPTPKGGRLIDPLIRQMEEAVQKMRGFRSSVVYLGPLRDDPRVAYPLGHTVSNLPVGRKGEFTAAFLEKNRSRLVRYTEPGGRVTSDTVMNAASKWCRYLGIAERVSVSAKAKMGHELSLELDGHHRDPTAIGVGASQLIPVVVLVLGAKPGQLVLLEQPELHLHPKVQSRLADFFAFARPDIQILVETHSEYLITRLRVRTAEGRLDPSQVAALFVSKREGEILAGDGEKAESGGEFYSQFKLLKLDDFGNFDSWPDDFFDSLEQDSVELATAVTNRLRESRSDHNF